MLDKWENMKNTLFEAINNQQMHNCGVYSKHNHEIIVTLIHYTKQIVFYHNRKQNGIFDNKLETMSLDEFKNWSCVIPL